MTTPADDVTSPILATAENLLSSRLEAIKPLAELIAERKRLRDLLEQTEKPYGAAYAAATAAGWTAEELRQMGAEEPTRRPQGRPKGSRTRRKTSPASPVSPPAPRTEDADTAGPGSNPRETSPQF
ncbi:hypothetical protein [Streptomyces atacamensis]|uniref:hypothetical protein n=1 Tax=Streptomyces atacamensis TaxID=531966 RepID=UPI00399CE380